MYTLWRGTTLLGRFAERGQVEHHGKSVGAAGILEPTDAFVGIKSMMQTRAQLFPGQPFLQHEFDAEDGNAPAPHRDRAFSAVALSPLSSEEAKGVPPELVFEIRDAVGGRVDTGMVMLQLRKLPDGKDPGPIPEDLAFLKGSREVWHVMFSVKDEPL